jgi:hypothetical protein
MPYALRAVWLDLPCFIAVGSASLQLSTAPLADRECLGLIPTPKGSTSTAWLGVVPDAPVRHLPSLGLTAVTVMRLSQ